MGRKHDIEFMPTYLKYKYIFFLISISGRIRIFFQLSRIRIRGQKFRILIPALNRLKLVIFISRSIYSTFKTISCPFFKPFRSGSGLPTVPV